MIDETIAKRRLGNQHLVGAPMESVVEVVRYLGAVQSQDYSAAKWGVAQRLFGVNSADIDQVFNDGLILRTHIMRPTWHFVMPEDIRWMQMLTAPRVKTLMNYYNRQLELDDAVFLRTNDILGEALQGGKYLTRNELAAVLEKNGIPAQGQRLGHMVMRAELDAIICSGPLRGKQFTYALVSERAPHAKVLAHDEALAELALRYFTSHGPATQHDFAWWSGLRVVDARAGLEMVESQLVSQVADGQAYWFVPSSLPKIKSSTLHLLPNYDELLISYKGYAAIFDAAHLGPNALDALRAHIIVLDGQVVGGWKRTIRKDGITIYPNLLVPFTASQHKALAQAARLYSVFMGQPVVLG